MTPRERAEKLWGEMSRVLKVDDVDKIANAIEAALSDEREACALCCKEAADATMNAIETQHPSREGKAYLFAFSGGASMCMDTIRARGAK